MVPLINGKHHGVLRINFSECEVEKRRKPVKQCDLVYKDIKKLGKNEILSGKKIYIYSIYTIIFIFLKRVSP